MVSEGTQAFLAESARTSMAAELSVSVDDPYYILV